ncbi:LRR receptor-like serine/threonine-protein kinase RCH1, partial [Bienertia sinuspersici]
KERTSLVNKLKFWINEDLDRFRNCQNTSSTTSLSFVPIKDIVRARILSKTWKSLSNSYENFSQIHGFADNHLSRVVQQQIPVLKLAVIGSEFCGVDQLMELVRILSGNNNAGMYSSLQQLYLSRILLFNEESLSNIASCCPEIEIIEFNCCSFGIESLMLSEFSKLKKAFVVGKQDFLDSVDIRETNLESFHCEDVKCFINLAACSNIRVLELNQCYISEPDLLKDLTTSFPLLEKAGLSDVRTHEDLDRITVANNSHLRSLKLLSNRVIQEISTDCPKLRNFKYIGAGFEKVYLDCQKLRICYYKSSWKVPRLILLDLLTDIQYSVFSLFVYYKLGKSSFISTKKILEQIPGCTNVYLHFNWFDTYMVGTS